MFKKIMPAKNLVNEYPNNIIHKGQNVEIT